MSPSAHRPTPPEHARARRVARGVASLLVTASSLYWLEVAEVGRGAQLGLAAALLLTTWLSVSEGRAGPVVAAWSQAVMAIGALVCLHGSVGPQRGPAQLEPTMLARLALAASVFAALYLLLLSLRRSLLRLLGRLLVWVRLLGGGAGVAHALVLLGLSLGAAEFFFLWERTEFGYSGAKHHPLFAFHIPGSYYYAHATERQVRDTHQFQFQQRKPDSVIRIVLNGASTMGGFGLDPPDRPAEVLRAMLADGIAGRPVEVLFIGVSGKYQLNELVDAVVTVPHWDPDLVISFDGFNEMTYGESSSHYEGMPYTADEIDRVLDASPLVGWFFTRSSLGAALWKRGWLAPAAPRTWLDEPLSYEPPRYFSYLRLTARNLAEAGIPYVYDFCPNVYAWLRHVAPADVARARGARLAHVTDGRVDGLDHRRRPLAAAIVREEGQVPYSSLEPLRRFATADEAFLDDCHLTRAGVRAIMADLARRIPGWLDEWRPPRSGAASATPSGGAAREPPG